MLHSALVPTDGYVNGRADGLMCGCVGIWISGYVDVDGGKHSKPIFCTCKASGFQLSNLNLCQNLEYKRTPVAAAALRITDTTVLLRGDQGTCAHLERVI